MSKPRMTRLKAERLVQGYTLRELADKAGFSFTALRSMEVEGKASKVAERLGFISRLSEALSLPPSSLFDTVTLEVATYWESKL